MSHVIYDHLTLDQFLRLPEAKPALEYIDGEVVQKVGAKRAHSVMQGLLCPRLQEFVWPRKMGLAYPELRCTYGGRSFVHDLCFIARGRIPIDKQGRKVEDIRFPPDLAIEILSPGQTVKKLTARLDWCVRHGVRLGWLIQPRKQRVFVLRPGHPVEVLESGAILSGEDAIPGFALPIAEMFGWLEED